MQGSYRLVNTAIFQVLTNFSFTSHPVVEAIKAENLTASLKNLRTNKTYNRLSGVVVILLG